MQIQNLEQLLWRPTAYANRLGDVEELNHGTFHHLREASIVDGSSDNVEDLLAKLLLAREQSSNADLGGFYPASNFVPKLLPLKALNVSNAELFDVEIAEARIHRGFSNDAVDLDALAEVAEGEHALRDVAEVVDGVRGDQIDLANAAGGTVTAAVNGVYGGNIRIKKYKEFKLVYLNKKFEIQGI